MFIELSIVVTSKYPGFKTTAGKGHGPNDEMYLFLSKIILEELLADFTHFRTVFFLT